MNEFCKYCGLCCKIIPAKNGIVIREGFSDSFGNLIQLTTQEACQINKKFVKDIKNILGDVDFYKCKFVSDGNICSNPNKPNSCINYPSNPLDIVPEECCYIGEIFLKREELKQKIRRYKEEIVHYEALINSDDKESSSYRKIIKTLQKHIDNYSIYGSDNW